VQQIADHFGQQDRLSSTTRILLSVPHPVVNAPFTWFHEEPLQAAASMLYNGVFEIGRTPAPGSAPRPSRSLSQPGRVR
jgi:hypothetical protein